MEILIPLILLAALGAGAAGLYLSHKRRKEIGEWAASRGWSFWPDRDHSLESRFSEFSCLKEGSKRHGRNVIRGDHGGRAFCAFDYHYVTYSRDSKGGRTSHHHHFSAVVVESGLRLKPLFLRSEGLLDRVVQFFGIEDINFESREFSRAFHVKAPDRRWAFDVLPQETMEFLLRSPRFVLEFEGGRVMARRSRLFSIADFEAALAVVGGVLDRLPRSVASELQGAR